MEFFDDIEVNIIKTIVKLYNYNKCLMLYAEDLTDETFLPPINEIRDANDHIMRVFAVVFGFGDTGKETEHEYIKSNLNAALSHVYRATYEHLDYIKIYQHEAIQNNLANIYPETLATVFPEYYRDINPRLVDAINIIPDYRKRKNIADPNLEQVEAYMAIIETTKKDYNEIIRMLPSLNEYQAKKLRDNWKRRLIDFVSGIIVILLGTAIYSYIFS
ncbi:MAG: hypothetical protein IPI63_07525 [Methanothrix sp.]|jgi:hypothetical protein|uniref:hypothetical protein n=2 Tax=Methanothrix sp. TaxID=90426 RepID=UPI0025DC2274|nr:hypothetical protein [Methanothrix sp.]MBK7386570.1 hypothetical protein [Methanothrix sp.]HPW73917.1 hypothetical protein [Methanothrix sp.]